MALFRQYCFEMGQVAHRQMKQRVGIPAERQFVASQAVRSVDAAAERVDDAAVAIALGLDIVAVQEDRRGAPSGARSLSRDRPRDTHIDAVIDVDDGDPAPRHEGGEFGIEGRTGGEPCRDRERRIAPPGKPRPVARGQETARPSAGGTALEPLELRQLRKRYSDAELRSRAAETGFTFAAQGPIEVAAAVADAASGKVPTPQLVTGVDPLGQANLVMVQER